jgi:hypothetical protein
VIIEGVYHMPYAYTVDAVVQRPRSLGRISFVRIGKVEKVITEVSPSDAPVVATLDYGRYGTEHEIRYFNGAFYAHARSADGVYPKPSGYSIIPSSGLLSPRRKSVKEGPPFALMQIDKTGIGMTNDEISALGSFTRNGFFIEAVLDERIVEIVGSNEVTRRASAQAVVEDLLIVKQDVWARIEEPGLIFRTPLTAHPHVAVCYGRPGVPDVDAFVGSPDKTLFYALTDRASLEDYIRECGEGFLETLNLGDLPNVRIHDPTVFTKDWVAAEDRQLMSFAVGAYIDQLGAQSLEFVSAWVSAREAISAFDNNGNHDDLQEAMASCLPVLVDDYSGEPTQDTRVVGSLLPRYVSQPRAASVKGMTP